MYCITDTLPLVRYTIISIEKFMYMLDFTLPYFVSPFDNEDDYCYTVVLAPGDIASEVKVKRCRSKVAARSP